MIYSLQNPLWGKKGMGRLLLLGQDKIAASRFILSLKYVLAKTHTHVYETIILSRQCTSSDNKQQYSKVEKTSQVFSMWLLLQFISWKEFPAAQGERAKVKPGELSDDWGDRGEGLGARVHSTEYRRGKKMNRNGNTDTFRESHSFSTVQACMRKLSRGRERTIWEIYRKRYLNVDTGLKIVPVSTRQRGKTHNP